MMILGVIPARYASTRFPAKPLADIDGKSMVERVYIQASLSKRISKVVVATDDQRIFDHVRLFKGSVCMTSPDHASGTDRCFEAMTKQREKFDYVINIQGDEPFISPEQIDLLASLLDGNTELATLVKKINDQESLFNPNVVKIIRSANNQALYFSRSTIPHIRNAEYNTWLSKHTFFKHIGMYGYRSDILEKITRLKVSALEKAESLEQLRWLENGFKVKVAETDLETIGVDTREDLEKALAFIKNNQ
ncbi:MAG TPA: 3-deoxy-manno-octulosonate cytidylyltransferase [Cyclobacteriaceae bacterium]|nr:3-deoxy-manno-octulosonate cytidylyltransferase [Cyclobacteriaceae bacterium]